MDKYRIFFIHLNKKELKKRGLVKTKEVDKGTLTYRERVAAPGHAIIELNE